jgi:endoglucanase
MNKNKSKRQEKAIFVVDKCKKTLNSMKILKLSTLFIFFIPPILFAQSTLQLTDKEYFATKGLQVLVFHDNHPESHQGGISLVQNGVGVATNGDLRLEATPGQWQPVPKFIQRTADKAGNQVMVRLCYPDSSINGSGFNPIYYPDLSFYYQVNVKAEGNNIRIRVDLDKPLPQEWIGKVGFNLELFPGVLFGKSYFMDDKSGLFPPQLNGNVVWDKDKQLQVEPLAKGTKLVVAPASDAQRISIESLHGGLELLDGRLHNNGWFIVRSTIPAGATQNAIEWVVSPNVLPNWKYEPALHYSQLGYHPKQEKKIVIECDITEQSLEPIQLIRILPSGQQEVVRQETPKKWGKFVDNQYFTFDFSAIQNEGLYQIVYGNQKSEAFGIRSDIYDRHVWQPTLEYFMPVQMCHMRVNDRYKTWHGLCHMDDALMAATDTNHFDGYLQGKSTLTKYKPLEQVPDLNIGGWHDAGDDDLRIESQAKAVQVLALCYNSFQINHDETTIDQSKRLVELHQPDGKADALQQIEHGVLSILGGYKSLGRLYRGIICPTLRQYVLLGDWANMTDNKKYNPQLKESQSLDHESGILDDRWVFTEENPHRELLAAACLATASVALKGYNDVLSKECLAVAETYWKQYENQKGLESPKIELLAELILATQQEVYKKQLVAMLPAIEKNIGEVAWAVARVMPHLKDKKFAQKVQEAVRSHYTSFQSQIYQNPFGVSFQPSYWGFAWRVQDMGVKQYYMHKAWQDIVPKEDMLNVLNYVLGCNPGFNSISLASGVGAKSATVAYGFNRSDWTYIPGGVVSGPAYLGGIFPERKQWPFLWQQAEYVIGGGAENFMFLVLAAKDVLK